MKAVAIAQFDVFENPTPGQRPAFPYLVVMQHDQLDHYTTRFVMPLARLTNVPAALPRRLTQTVQIAGETLYPAAHLSAALPTRVLTRRVGRMKADSGVLRDALDAVVGGV